MPDDPSKTDRRLVPAAALWLALAMAPLRGQGDGAGGPPAGAPAGPPPQPVRVRDVVRERIGDRRLVVGELRAVQRAAVASREPGIVLELPVREGERVAAGAALARLDDARLVLELAEVDADRAVAVAKLGELAADLELRRWWHEAQQELGRRGSAHERELREAASTIAVAESRVQQTERQIALLDARRALLERRIADMRVVAPFDAVIVARRTEIGAFVAAGGAVVELVSVGAVEAWFAVPQEHAVAVRRAGATVELKLPTGAALRTGAFRIVPDVAPGVRAFPLVVPLDDPDGVLQPGMSARAWVPAADEAEHLLVPADAVLRSEVGAFVYAARGTGGLARAVPVPVEVLFADGARYAVRSAALTAGEPVVVEGNERLFPNAPIVPTPASER